ncbi:MAG: GGDEF domain-containing protein [Lautropia sp.]|nr:GGDEF domain-containing protein [Lautropia sp.]
MEMETESERRHHVSLAKATLLHLSQSRLPPTPENYATAWHEVAQQVDPPTRPMTRPGRRFPDGIVESYEDSELAVARRLAERRQRLIVSLTSLLETICDVAPALAGDDTWINEQFSAIRQAISQKSEMVDRGELEQVRQAVKTNLKEHGELLSVRRSALTELKGLLMQWVGNLSDLMDTSVSSYSDSLDSFVSRIEGVSDIDDLALVLGDIVGKTAHLRRHLTKTRQQFEETCKRANELERCVSELSSELTETTALAVTDQLTSLLNRRGLSIAYEELQLESRRRGTPFVVALLDLDHFKQINDTQGHNAGDDALRYFAAAIKGQLRPSDRCSRYGGDEFVLLLPGVGLHMGVEIMRRLQRVVVERTLVYGSGEINLSFSAGVAVAEPNMSLEDALHRADDALYEAKLAGRNRVCPFEGKQPVFSM